MNVPTFTFIYDTYCGWCYGAQKIITALARNGATIECLHRQLFSGAYCFDMTGEIGEKILNEDLRIAKLSGQPFSQCYIDNLLGVNTEILDSTLTAQAAVLARPHGTTVELALLRKLQHARYVEGVSAKDSASVVQILLDLKVGSSLQDIEIELLSTKTVDDAAQMQHKAASVLTQNNVSGVPILIKKESGDESLINLAKYFSCPEKVSELLVKCHRP